MGRMIRCDISSVVGTGSLILVGCLMACGELYPLQPSENHETSTPYIFSDFSHFNDSTDELEELDDAEVDVLDADGNDFPMILVHGAFGWGRDEVGGSLGHYYWGGYDDLEQMLRDVGHEAHTVALGPLSSNWDRASELFAQIAGRKTDYGLAHSLMHNHARFGRDYTGVGLVDDWGEPGNHSKVHLITHSMGAQTARMLAQLLEHGSAQELEQDYNGHDPVSPLFDPAQSTKDRIHSILSVAGSHNGSTLSNGLKEMVPVIEELVVGLLSFVGMDSNDTVAQVYDVKLDHFGFTPRGAGESLHAYFGRVAEAADDFLNSGRKDICLWDLSPEGSAEQNAWVHAQDNIYYLSYSSTATSASPVPAVLDNLEHHQLPEVHTLPAFAVTATMLGRYTCADSRYQGMMRARDGQFYGMSLDERVVIDSAWWENDGVVNTISQDGPWLYPDDYAGPQDIIIPWNNLSVPPKGVWNHGAVFDGLDHLDATGLEFMIGDIHGVSDFDHIEDWYLDRANFLRSLP